eukprot:126355-Chlamydomonas_euryale.AAC.13
MRQARDGGVPPTQAAAASHLRPLVFHDSSGGVAKVVDQVCWRSLEGRPCMTACERHAAPQHPVVVLPVVVVRRQHLEEGACEACTGAHGWCRAHAVLRMCRHVQAALQAVNIDAVLDDAPHMTPGAKFNLWEARRAAVRVEIGPQEASSGRVTLALDPSLASRACKQAAAAYVASARPDAYVRGADQCGGRSTRLVDIPVEQLTEILLRLLENVRSIPAECRHLHLHLSERCAFGAAAGGDGGDTAKATVTAVHEGTVCVEHLRFLVGAGRRCRCGAGHVSLQRFKAAVGDALQAQSPGVMVTGWLRLEPGAPGCLAALREQIAQQALTSHQHDPDDAVTTVEDDADAGPCSLFISGIPRGCSAQCVRIQLQHALSPFGASRVCDNASEAPLISAPLDVCSYHVIDTKWLHSRMGQGKAVLLPSESAAAEAIAALDGELCLALQVNCDNRPARAQQLDPAGCRPQCTEPHSQRLSLSFATGRRDTLFPDLPASLRARLRVDAVAAYSVTDQHTARQMASLLHVVASAMWSLQVAKPLLSTPAETLHTAPQTDAGALLMVRPLPLRVTDGTACAGGNVMQLLPLFESTMCVELDEDRTADLVHNLIVLGHDTKVLANASSADIAHPLQVLCADYTDVMLQLQQHVVILDPPWGGPQYDGSKHGTPTSTETGVCLGNMAIDQVCSTLLAPSGAAICNIFADGRGMPMPTKLSPQSLRTHLVALKIPSRIDKHVVLSRVSSRMQALCPLHTRACHNEHCCAWHLHGLHVQFGRTSFLIMSLLPRGTCGSTAAARAVRDNILKPAVKFWAASNGFGAKYAWLGY